MTTPVATPTPRTFATLYSDETVDDHRDDYTAVMATFDATAAVTPAALYTAVTSVDPSTPNAYIGMFDAPGVPGGLSMVLHGITRFPSRLGVTSPWDDRSFGFLQDVVAEGGDIPSVEVFTNFFELNPGGPVTVPATLALVDELWDADPDLCMLPFMAHVPAAAPAANAPAAATTRAVHTRRLMFVPARYLPIVINRRLTPRELWTDLGCAIADDGNLEPCQNLIDWILCAGVRPAAGAPSALCLPTPHVPLVDAALFQHRRRQLYLQLPALQVPASSPDSSTQMFHLMGQVVEEQRLAREGSEAYRARPKATKTPSSMWADNIQYLMLLCGVDLEEDLPRMWHILAASTHADRHALDGFMRRLSVTDNAHSQGPIITPELTKRLISLNFAGNDRDDLAQGIQPFNLIVSDPGDAEGTRLALEADTAGNEYDQLMLGGTSQALSDLRELRTVAKINVRLTFRQARRKLQALRLLLLAMLGPHHTLYQAFHVFLRTYTQQEDTWISRMRGALAPATLLRYVQLKLNVWFRQQETRDYNPPVPPPNFGYLFDQLNEDCTAWTPHLPNAYLSLLVPVPPVTDIPSRGPRPAGIPAPPTPASTPVKTRGEVVDNTSRSPLLAAFLPAVQLTTIKAMISTAGRPPPTILRDGKQVAMCVTFHLKGKCFKNCDRKADHLPHTDAENAPLVSWVTAALA